MKVHQLNLTSVLFIRPFVATLVLWVFKALMKLFSEFVAFASQYVFSYVSEHWAGPPYKTDWNSVGKSRCTSVHFGSFPFPLQALVMHSWPWASRRRCFHGCCPIKHKGVLQVRSLLWSERPPHWVHYFHHYINLLSFIISLQFLFCSFFFFTISSETISTKGKKIHGWINE